MTEEPKGRTLQQNKCLHGWLTAVAETLNDAGLDMKKTLREDADIPWTGPAAKEFLWRPIQEALANVESSSDTSTKEVILISEVITRHIGQKHGVTLPPWPTRHNGGGKE